MLAIFHGSSIQLETVSEKDFYFIRYIYMYKIKIVNLYFFINDKNKLLLLK